MTARPFAVERRPSGAPKTPLQEPVRAALGSIAADLRDLPRDCLVDRAELIHWLAKMARRVDGVAAMTVIPNRPIHSKENRLYNGLSRFPGRNPRNDSRCAPTSREIAEAVFGRSAPMGPPKPRTITNRKGRAVLVEVRRRRHDVPAQLAMEV